MWGLDKQGQDSQGFWRVNPTYVATAESCGILCEISPFKNYHDRPEPKG